MNKKTLMIVGAVALVGGLIYYHMKKEKATKVVIAPVVAPQGK